MGIIHIRDSYHLITLSLIMENAALLKAIIQNAIDGIITIDDKGIVEYMNPAACGLFQYSTEEVVGRNISVLMPPPYKVKREVR